MSCYRTITKEEFIKECVENILHINRNKRRNIHIKEIKCLYQNETKEKVFFEIETTNGTLYETWYTKPDFLISKTDPDELERLKLEIEMLKKEKTEYKEKVMSIISLTKQLTKSTDNLIELMKKKIDYYDGKSM